MQVRLDRGHNLRESLLLEPDSCWGETTGLEIASVVVEPDKHGRAPILITNPMGYTQRIRQGAGVGRASRVDIVSPMEPKQEQIAQPVQGTGEEGFLEMSTEPNHPSVVQQVKATCVSRSQERRLKLTQMLSLDETELAEEDKRTIESALLDLHEAFILEDKERGETDLLQLEIETGDATPIKQPVRRLPFAVRQEVAQQLRRMQEMGVIQPSNSPWASPIVLVRKKDNSLRFCIDYRKLNAVTKPDSFPLPRIDDLLDELGESRYFSTLDLAAGYWQIPVHQDFQEKTAFATHQGLYQFTVMPFGLRNAPAAFQRMMQCVVSSLNPEDGPTFVAVYLDDILVFSKTLEEHIQHLQLVMNRLMEAGLKLNPSKCHFVRKEVQYLGHLITPSGLKPNPERVAGVERFGIGFSSYIAYVHLRCPV